MHNLFIEESFYFIRQRSSLFSIGDPRLIRSVATDCHCHIDRGEFYFIQLHVSLPFSLSLNVIILFVFSLWTTRVSSTAITAINKISNKFSGYSQNYSFTSSFNRVFFIVLNKIRHHLLIVSIEFIKSSHSDHWFQAVNSSKGKFCS